MSYNLYVTKKDYWFDETKDKNIDPKAFIEFCESYPALTIRRKKADEVDAVFVDKNRPNEEWHLTYRRGSIKADMRVVPKEVFVVLLAMAEKLDAKVQGEEAEVYSKKDIDSFLTVDELEQEQKEFEAKSLAIQKSERRKKVLKSALLLPLKVFFLFALASTIIGIVLIPRLIKIWFARKK